MKTNTIKKDYSNYSGSMIFKVIGAIFIAAIALGLLLLGIFYVNAFFTPDTSIFTTLPFLAPKTAITHIGTNDPATIGERLFCLFMGLSMFSLSITCIISGAKGLGIIKERYDEKKTSLFSNVESQHIFGAITAIFVIVAFIVM